MTIRRWSFLSTAARTITPHWTPMTCRRIWSRWSGFSGECWRIPGKPSSGRWKSKAKATSPWHSSRGSSPVEPCAAPCGRSGAKVEEVPAQGASGAVLGLCARGFGWAVFPVGNRTPGVGFSSRRKGWGQDRSPAWFTSPGNAGRFKGFRAFKGSLHNGVKLPNQAEKWGQFTAKARHISK